MKFAYTLIFVTPILVTPYVGLTDSEANQYLEKGEELLQNASGQHHKLPSHKQCSFDMYYWWLVSQSTAYTKGWLARFSYYCVALPVLEFQQISSKL